jgi:transcription elongation GreA/GreB family factor
MRRQKEIKYRESLFDQEPIKMTLQTKQRLEADLKKVNEELKNKSESLGATQDSAQDWHDNAAYDTLLQQLDVLKTQQTTITAALEKAEIIMPRQEVDAIQQGNTVLVRYQNSQQPEKISLLGPKDSGTERSWISMETALAKALVGQKAGSTIKLANGMIVEIIEVLPGEF